MSATERTASDPRAQQVLDFWFGPLDGDGLAQQDKAQTWWQKNPEFDATIKDQFGALHLAASNGALDHWQAEPENALALILVLDQFSRNLYRNTPAMVAQDADALAVAQTLIDRGDDKSFPPAWRAFVYLPFEHSENLADQEQCTALFTAMLEGLDGPARTVVEQQLDFARRHHVIIERFGRFPHRNAFLGRSSTAEEIEFLEQPNSSF